MKITHCLNCGNLIETTEIIITLRHKSIVSKLLTINRKVGHIKSNKCVHCEWSQTEIIRRDSLSADNWSLLETIFNRIYKRSALFITTDDKKGIV